MVTLDYSHLTSVVWGVCKGFQARLDKVEAWQARPTKNAVYKDPRTGFGSIALQQAHARDPGISREEVKAASG